MEKPSSPSCERNSSAILEVLKRFIPSQDSSLLEVGSGTGQHAAFYSSHFPPLWWQSSDRIENHPGIKLWQQESARDNFLLPIEFEVGRSDFPKGDYDFVFTANTLHIMGWKQVKMLIKMLGRNLRPKTMVIIYGPFNYQGKFTSESNKQFDQILKEKNPISGIRSMEDISNNMAKNGLYLLEDIEMPANNRILVFQKG